MKRKPWYADKMTRAAYVPDLDGIRALALWLVMLFHAGAPLMSGGWVGVDVFFVLSGFLITSLLVREFERHGRVALGRFWLRRLLRLLPAYYAYLIPTTALMIFSSSWDDAHGGWTIPRFIASLWLYFSNIAPQGGIWEYQFLVRHLWSLAVEQQFYLILCLLYLIARLSGVKLGKILVAIFLFSVVASKAQFLPGSEKLSIFGRGISLIMGCIMAYYAPWLSREMPACKLHYLHIASIIFSIICIGIVFWQCHALDMPEFGAVTPLSIALYTSLAFMIAGYWYSWSDFGRSILRLPVLVWAGKLSYGVYIYHMMVWGLTFSLDIIFLEPFGSSQMNYAVKLFLYFLLAHLIAAVSFKYIESPFLKAKKRLS